MCIGELTVARLNRSVSCQLDLHKMQKTQCIFWICLNSGCNNLAQIEGQFSQYKILTHFIFSGSSVCSNTPSLVGENLESFSLGESEKVPGSSGGATDKKDTNAWAINTALVQVQAPPLRRSLFSNVPPTMNFVHHNEVSVIFSVLIGLDVSNLVN